MKKMSIAAVTLVIGAWLNKQARILKLLFGLIFFSYSTFIHSSAEGTIMINELQQDIRAIKTGGAVRLDISEIIRKHVLVGMNKEQVFKILSDADFAINKYEKKPQTEAVKNNSDEFFIATWNYKKGIVSHNEARLLLSFSKTKLVDVTGEIFYRTL